jgi:two-component system chemotaxis response regulator CheB
MPRIRVLVVDDSVVIRKLVSDALSAEPRCEVVGAAANGRIALQKISQVNPDVLTMDVEMPEMDGLETLAAIRKTHPKLPVIMFSAVTERAAAATLKALSLGATDYVTKPSAGKMEEALQKVREQLIPKVLAFGEPRGARFATTGATPRPSLPRPSRPRPIQIVAIGCSTGGPNALASIFTQLAKLLPRLPVPVVVVQHMPTVFTRLLADRLRAQSGFMVREAQGGETLEPGEVWIAQGDHHMVVTSEGAIRRLALHQGPHENSCRPAVDVLFRSVSAAYGGQALGVVLTGMGQDGLHGCEHLHEAGSPIVVQDEATSVVWGMPGFVANAGLADAVVALDQIPTEIARRLAGLHPAQSSNERARSKSVPCP